MLLLINASIKASPCQQKGAHWVVQVVHVGEGMLFSFSNIFNVAQWHSIIYQKQKRLHDTDDKRYVGAIKRLVCNGNFLLSRYDW